MKTSLNLPFDLQLQMAQRAIERQVKRAKAANRQQMRASLWVRFINHAAMHTSQPAGGEQ